MASLLCAAAPGIGWLIAARAVQGIGGALMTPASLAIIEAAFQPDDRTHAIGTWAGFAQPGCRAGSGLATQGPHDAVCGDRVTISASLTGPRVSRYSIGWGLRRIVQQAVRRVNAGP